MRTNKFTRLLSLALIMSGLGLTDIDANDFKTMRIGYSNGNMGLNLGLNIPMEIEGAIQFPEDEMQRLQSARIKAVRLAVGNTLTKQANSIFITDNLESGKLYQQPAGELAYGWNYIELDKPFEITGRQLFVGFTYESAGEVLSFDGEPDNELANWVNIRQKGEANFSGWAHQTGGAHNLQVIIEGENLPQNDIAIEGHLIRSYACADAATPMAIVIRNNGAAPVSTIDVAVTADDVALPARTISCGGIESNELALVDIGPLEVEGNSLFDIKVEVTAVNGMPDERAADNSASVENVISRADYAPRKVLLEHFSTMKCSNCPSAHTLIEDALRYRSDVIHVVYHSGFGTDALTTEEAQAYLWLFTDGNDGSIYAPGASLDRVNLSAFGATDGSSSTLGPVFQPRRETMGRLLDHRLSTPALVSLGIEQAYNETSRRLDVSVKASIPNGSAQRLSAADPRLTVLLTEDGIEGYQSGVTVPMTGPYIHDRALRRVLTDVWGDKINFENADFASKTYSINLPEDWDDSRMRIVAFISDFNSTSTAGCQVFNAEEALLDKSSSTETIATEQASLFIKDGKVLLPANCSAAYVYDISGRLLRAAQNGSELNLGDMRGTLIVKIETGEGCKTFKILR